jgi:hypothetical protein
MRHRVNNWLFPATTNRVNNWLFPTLDSESLPAHDEHFENGYKPLHMLDCGG